MTKDLTAPYSPAKSSAKSLAISYEEIGKHLGLRYHFRSEISQGFHENSIDWGRDYELSKLFESKREKEGVIIFNSHDMFPQYLIVIKILLK